MAAFSLGVLTLDQTEFIHSAALELAPEVSAVWWAACLYVVIDSAVWIARLWGPFFILMGALLHREPVMGFLSVSLICGIYCFSDFRPYESLPWWLETTFVLATFLSALVLYLLGFSLSRLFRLMTASRQTLTE
ncbi:MAG: hypothetical protein AAGK14_15750 [Verrucomicrobiota bacterium]